MNKENHEMTVYDFIEERKLNKTYLTKTCQACVENCAKSKSVTPCVSYEFEPCHKTRLITECPLISIQIDYIYTNVIYDVKTELTKRDIPLTEVA